MYFFESLFLIYIFFLVVDIIEVLSMHFVSLFHLKIIVERKITQGF